MVLADVTQNTTLYNRRRCAFTLGIREQGDPLQPPNSSSPVVIRRKRDDNRYTFEKIRHQAVAPKIQLN